MPKMVIVEEQRCLGCKSCMIACAMAHSDAKTLGQAVRSTKRPQSRMHVEAACGYGMPLQCRHCEDAPCMAVCPTEAIRRPSPDGPVLIEAKRCIGCRYCLLACPFGVIDLSRDGKAMVKCDLCIERTKAGELPACVAACPTHALKYEEVKEFLRHKRRKAGEQMAAARPEAMEKHREPRKG